MIVKMFDQFDKIKLIVMSVEAIFGVIGASLILTEHHPYLALGSLAIARTSTKWEEWIKNKEKKQEQGSNK